MNDTLALKEEVKYSSLRGLENQPEVQTEVQPEVQEESSSANYIQNKHFLSKMFNCNICKKMPFNPETCKNCQSIYCEKCISDVLIETKATCPKCNEFYIKYPIHNIIKNILSDFYVPCINTENGCSAVVKYNALPEHVHNCLYTPHICPFCKEQIKKKDYESHTTICELSELYCEKCKFKGNKLKFSSHYPFCEYFKNLIENSENIFINKYESDFNV